MGLTVCGYFDARLPLRRCWRGQLLRPSAWPRQVDGQEARLRPRACHHWRSSILRLLSRFDLAVCKSEACTLWGFLGLQELMALRILADDFGGFIRRRGLCALLACFGHDRQPLAATTTNSAAGHAAGPRVDEATQKSRCRPVGKKRVGKSWTFPHEPRLPSSVHDLFTGEGANSHLHAPSARSAGPMADRARRISTPLPAPVRQIVLVSASAFALGCSAHALRALDSRSQPVPPTSFSRKPRLCC